MAARERTEAQKAATERMLATRMANIAARKEESMAAAGTPGMLGEEERAEIQAALGERERKAPERALPEQEARPKPVTLADEVTQYFQERNEAEYGAAVDVRLQQEREREEATRAEQRRQEPPKPKIRADARPAVAAMLYAEARKKQQMRESLPVRDAPRDPKTGARLPQEHQVRTPMRTGRRYTPDTTRIDPALIHKDEESGLPFVHGWTSVEDSLGQGERSWHRVEEMISYGAEVIRKKDGTPLVSRFGVAMQQHPDHYNAMVRDKARVGVYDLDDVVEPVLGMQREIDRKRSGVSQVFRYRGHGLSRQRENLEEEDRRYFDE